MERVKLPQKAKGARPYFFDDPAVDRAIAIITALAGEVSVLHDQIDTIRRKLEEKGIVTAAELDDFLPSKEVEAARDAWREQFLENVLRIVHQEREALEEGDQSDDAYKTVIENVTGNSS
ncbi:MAG: hypothetical protein D6782_04540 [Alphaproteobacteria bacterium]|nr:MAG: hypothetical protein D6782_04540 [Alphaproteobacteria bacterium]